MTYVSQQLLDSINLIENEANKLYKQLQQASLAQHNPVTPAYNRNGFNLSLLDPENPAPPEYVIYQVGTATHPRISKLLGRHRTSVATENGNIAHTYVLGIANKYNAPPEYINGKRHKSITKKNLRAGDLIRFTSDDGERTMLVEVNCTEYDTRAGT